MARIDKGTLTKREIVTEATKQFLEKGYTSTSVNAVAKALNISQGNLTFHYPTKEHLLAVLVDILCDFQWKLMEREADDGISSVMAICLELTSMASACESDPAIRDFFLASYASPMCLDIIRRNDAKRAKAVFGTYRPDWTDEQFAQAEILVSGIEHATLMVAGEPVQLESRITGALESILSIYGVPEEIRKAKLEKVFAMDYVALGRRIPQEFRNYVAGVIEETFQTLIGRS